jgi:cytochrome c oxidase assembly protein subunit 15
MTAPPNNPTAAPAGSRAPAGFSPATFRLALATCLATVVLIAAGGLVTSTRAGDAVPTWPLPLVLPLGGGATIELGHRQIAGLVALLTLALAVRLSLTEGRAWVRRLGWAALGLVMFQAALGGLRIAFPEDQYPDQRRVVAVLHACTAPLFFTLTAVLCTVVSARFLREAPARVDGQAGQMQALSAAVAGGLYVQIVLGAILRHADSLLALHVGWAIVVLAAAGYWSMTASAHFGGRPEILRPAQALMGLLMLQMVLGVSSLLLFNPAGRDISGRSLVPTAHVAVGVLCLGAAAVGVVCAFRFLSRPAGSAGALRAGEAAA